MNVIAAFIAPTLYAVLAAMAILLSMFRPHYNWDIICYIASAKSFEEKDIQALHSFTFEQVRRTVPEDTYRELVGGRPGEDPAYTACIRTDPSAFAEQLPFYQIRPVYTGSIYGLYKLGMDIGFATHFISGMAVAAAVALLYRLARSFLWMPLVFALPVAAVLFGALNVSRYSTPDGLAFCASVLSIYLFLQRRTTLLLAFLPVTVGVRTDLVLFIYPLLAFVFVIDANRRWAVALSAVATAAVYVAITRYWSNPGWAVTLYYTQVQILTHPISHPPTLTVQDYFHTLAKGSKNLAVNPRFILYLLTVFCSIGFIVDKLKTTPLRSVIASPVDALAIISMFFVASHFILFPVSYSRFFSGAYVIQAFSLLAMITEKWKNREGSAMAGNSGV